MNREQAVQTSINVAINEFKNASAANNPELEIKIPIGNSKTDRELFEKLINVISNGGTIPPIIERSINVLSMNIYNREKDKATYIRHMLFDNQAAKISDSYYKKLRLMAVNIPGYIPHKLTVSIEEPMSAFKTSSTCNIRFKLRYSFVRPEMPKWRFDLTVVRELPCNKMSDIPLITKQFFILRGNEIPHGQYEAEIEYIGEQSKITASDLSVVNSLFKMLDPSFASNQSIQDTIHFAASHIITDTALLPSFQRNVSLKRLLRQAIAVTKQMYLEIFPPIKYFVSKKLDGNRALVALYDGIVHIVSDKYYEFPASAETGITIVDAELVYAGNEQSKFTLYLLDVLVLKSDSIMTKKFADRYAHFDDAIKLLSAYKVPINAKQFIEVTEDVEKSIQIAMESHPGIPEDGLIFNSFSEPYSSMNIYKWKPPQKNTIDFLARKCPDRVVGVYPYVAIPNMTLYLLFSGIDISMFSAMKLGFVQGYKDLFPGERSRYFPVQFSPSNYPYAYIFYSDDGNLDGKVVELLWKSDQQCRAGEMLASIKSTQTISNCWDLVRVRTDRSIESVDFGNDFRIAELTWQNYIDPFRVEDLWNPSKTYFTNTRADIYSNPNSFNSFVKSQLIVRYAMGAEHVIDLASGRGADFKKYLLSKVQNILFVEQDTAALTELIRRKYDIINDMNRKRRGDERLSMHVKTLHADLNEKHEYNTAAVGNTGFPLADVVFIHFAIHYMMRTQEAYINLLTFVRSILKPGGVFVFTCFNGAKVFDLLKQIEFGKAWSVIIPETGNVKFSIEKHYTSATLQKYGQEIAVKMAFAPNPIPENLVNIDSAITDAKKNGFELLERGGFGDFLRELAVINPRLANSLGEDDKQYCSLNEFVALRSKKTGGRKKKI